MYIACLVDKLFGVALVFLKHDNVIHFPNSRKCSLKLFVFKNVGSPVKEAPPPIEDSHIFMCKLYFEKIFVSKTVFSLLL